MRTIKFRAIKDDMSDFRFVYGNLIYDHKGNPRIQEDANKPTFTTCVNGSECQFTGLHDKNGKEIYEGDIVTDGVGKFKIIYDLKLAGYQPYCIFRDEPENYCEVIGNIYENPDLVKL